MKFREGIVPKNKTELRDSISDAMLRSPKRQFPEWEDLDGVFYSMVLGVENIRKSLGDVLADQVVDMLKQAKTHYENADNKLGGALMEDTKMVIMRRQVWAYPSDLYRWPRMSSLPEFSEEDAISKEVN